MSKSPRNIYEDGITQSYLANFINCRHRFYLKYVKGYREIGRKEAMEFGTIFHRLIEEHARHPRLKNFQPFLNRWLKKKYKSAKPSNYEATVKLAREALIVFEEYIGHYGHNQFEYFSQEETFFEYLTLPSGRKVPLRGRMDEIIRWHTGGLYLQENKTKSNINWEHIIATLPKNIQTMFYCTAMQLKHNVEPEGVLYNVIRKPSLRQRQKESDISFYDRIREDIRERPNHYFKRQPHEFAPGDLRAWQEHTLVPTLEHICDWFDETDPTNPWLTKSGERNHLHYERPFGVYEPMTNGKGDFYDLIVRGHRKKVEVVDEIFPELVDEDEDD